MTNLLQDLRFGLRSLIKHRGFTLVALITLALGVGANSTIFSVISATLLRTVPVSQPDNLVYVFNGTNGDVFGVWRWVRKRAMFSDWSSGRDSV